jgi:methionyl-tRNA formyltransferase
MRVAFAGTPEFAAVALERLHAEGFTVTQVLTQPDRPAGRGLRLQPSPVHVFAAAHALPLIQPRSLKLDGRFSDDAHAAQAALHAAAPDVMVVAAYGLILPDWALRLPRLGCINIHASLLPRWRGAAPIQRAIEAGDTHTGITIMQMDAGLDTGPMLLSASLEIQAQDSAGALQVKLARLGADLIVRVLRDAERGAINPVAQPTAGANYANKVVKQEAAIDWSQPAPVIERRVRAFDPVPGARFELDGETVKLWRARVADTAPSGFEPGTVLGPVEGRLRVACGPGVLELLTLQRPGGRPIAAGQFLVGKPIAAGRVLK